MAREVRVLIALGLLLAVALPTYAPAASPRVPEISATVRALSPTSRLVHIVNRGTVPGYLFLIRSVDSPKIVSATGPTGSCTTSWGLFFIASDKHYEYRAHCKFTLAPGRALDIRVSTRGAGKLGVIACPRAPAAGPCKF
jgi:hypothetical protein